VTHRFIQAQTIQNKRMLEHSPEDNHQQRLQDMKETRDNPELRRAFLRRQAMFTSLEESMVSE
jgi:3-(3-hydroxy-phenyl)propionate hydroxylase